MPRPVRKWIVKLRMWYADLRGHHGKRWDYEPSDNYFGEREKIMDLKDKIVGLALAALIALVGWNLKETWTMKEEVFKLQQGQVYFI